MVSLVTLLAGCASHPTRYIDGVMQATETRGVSDAKTRRVKDWPCLRVNAELLDRSERALAEADLEQARTLGLGFLDDAHQLSMDAAKQELARLDDAGWTDLAQTYFAYEEACDESARAFMTDTFIQRCDQQYWFLRHRIEKAQRVGQVHAVVEVVRDRVQIAASEKGRTLRQVLLAPFVIPTNLAVYNIKKDLKETERIADFKEAVRYMHAGSDDSGFTGTTEEWDLLVKHAPAFYQQVEEDPAYNPLADKIGRVYALDANEIAIDTNQPVVYAYARTVYLNGQDHKQLIYTVWYPEHPEAYKGDPEAGRFDGTTVRLTLDAKGRVAFVESSANCGCYYALFPAEQMERSAMQQFRRPMQDHDYCLEYESPDKYSVDVTGLFQLADTGEVRVWTAARDHMVLDITSDELRANKIASELGYQLRPYDELEMLERPDGGKTSMFYANGLVKGAERSEGTLLAATGMLSAGQPRQRGTQLIMFDAYDFDDPRLLEKTLRLPADF
jgi:hypothetical protein